MWGWRSGRTIAVGAAIAAFALFCVLPLAYMVAVWLSQSGREASFYAGLLLDSRQRGLLFNTAILGAGTALTATLVGVPLGVALARVTLPFKAGLRILLAAPALLPSYVIGLAWLYLGEASWMRSLPAGGGRPDRRALSAVDADDGGCGPRHRAETRGSRLADGQDPVACCGASRSRS